MTISPWEGWQFFAKYSEGFRPPSLRESVGFTFATLDPNPNLRPESGRSWEIGANLMKSNLFSRGDTLSEAMAELQLSFREH